MAKHMLILLIGWGSVISKRVLHFLMDKGCVIVAFAEDLASIRQLTAEGIVKLDGGNEENRIVPILLDLTNNNNNADVTRILNGFHIDHVVNYNLAENNVTELLQHLEKAYTSEVIARNDMDKLWKRIVQLGSMGGLFKMENPEKKLYRSALTLSFRGLRRDPIQKSVPLSDVPCNSSPLMLAVGESLRKLYREEETKMERTIMAKEEREKSALEQNYKNFCNPTQSRRTGGTTNYEHMRPDEANRLERRQNLNSQLEKTMRDFRIEQEGMMYKGIPSRIASILEATDIRPI